MLELPLDMENDSRVGSRRITSSAWRGGLGESPGAALGDLEVDGLLEAYRFLYGEVHWIGPVRIFCAHRAMATPKAEIFAVCERAAHRNRRHSG